MKTSNLHLKDALRDVLNEPPAEKGRKARKKKRKGDSSDSESGEESSHESDEVHAKIRPRK